MSKRFPGLETIGEATSFGLAKGTGGSPKDLRRTAAFPPQPLFRPHNQIKI